MEEFLVLDVENVALGVVKEPWRAEGNEGIINILCRFERCAGLTQVTWNRAFAEFPKLLNDLSGGEKIMVTGECTITYYLVGTKIHRWTSINASSIIAQPVVFEEILDECTIPVRRRKSIQEQKDMQHLGKFLDLSEKLKDCLERLEKLKVSGSEAKSNVDGWAVSVNSPLPKKKTTKATSLKVKASQGDLST